MLPGAISIHYPDGALALQHGVATIAGALEVGDLLAVGRVDGIIDSRVRARRGGQHAHVRSVRPHGDDRALTTEGEESPAVRRPGGGEELRRAVRGDVYV